MEPFDRLRAILAATHCTLCGRPIDPARIRILAEREGLTFVELPCLRCGIVALGLVTFVEGDGDRPRRRHGEFTAADEARFAGRPPISADDVLAAHEFLAGWRGDLRGLLEAGTGGSTEGSSRDR